VRSGQASQWKLKFSFENLTRSDFARLEAFIASMQGRFGVAAIPLPPKMGGDSQAVGVGVGKISTAATAGATSIVTNGWLANKVVLKSGDYIRISSNPKLYKVLADTSSNASGVAAVQIMPPLYANAAVNDAITSNSLTLQASLANDNQDFNYIPGALASFDIEFIEVLV
jgi:hypothetical protein